MSNRSTLDNTTDSLLQYFKNPLVLSQQIPSGQNTHDISELLSKLIFGTPAEGAKLMSSIKSAIDGDQNTADGSKPDNNTIPLIMLGPTENDSYGIPDAWKEDDISVKNIGAVLGTDEATTHDTKFCTIFAMNQSLGPSGRNTKGLQLFFNSIPTEQFSMCQPYLTVQLVSRRIGTTDNLATGVSIFKFLEGAADISKKSSYIKMLAGTDTSAAGTPGALLAHTGSAGMELFTMPQTLVPDAQYANHDANLRAVPIIDRFRPLLSLNDFTIQSHNAGAGTLSYKTANMSVTLHDRSRMAEIADLLNPGQYNSAKFMVEWGWSHPHGQPGSDIDNPYGNFLNSLRSVDVFRVTTYKLNFDEVGQVKIDIKLHAPAGIDIKNQNITYGVPGSENPIQQLSNLTTIIAEALGVLRNTNQLGKITAGVTLGRMGSAAQIPNLDDKIGDGDKTVNDVLEEIINELKKIDGDKAKDAAGELIESINKVYGEDKRRDEDTLVSKAYSSITKALDAKMKRLSGADDKVPKTPDPFINLTEIFTGNNSIVQPSGFVSLAKLLSVFVGQPLQSAGEYAEVHMVFHNFNDQAGFMGILKDGRLAANIGQFQININTFKASITTMFQKARSLEISVQEFITFVITNFVDNLASTEYGIQGSYVSTYNPETGRIEVKVRDSKNESTQLTDSISAALAVKCKYAEFRKPRVEVMLDSMPIWPDDGDESNARKEVLKIHIFDRQASSSITAVNTLRSAYNAYLDGDVNQEPYQELSAGAETPLTQDAGKSGDGLAGVGDKDGNIKTIHMYNAIRGMMPSIIYGSSASAIKNASLSTENDSLLSTAIMLGGGPNPGPLTPAGLDVGSLPLVVFPTKLSMTMMGCPILEYMQQFFIDFGTGTSVDNTYSAIKITHKISQGNFETNVAFAFVDAYGTFRSASSDLRALYEKNNTQTPSTS